MAMLNNKMVYIIYTLKSWLDCGKSSPFMAARFRVVNYYNLPR